MKSLEQKMQPLECLQVFLLSSLVTLTFYLKINRLLLDNKAVCEVTNRANYAVSRVSKRSALHTRMRTHPPLTKERPRYYIPSRNEISKRLRVV